MSRPVLRALLASTLLTAAGCTCGDSAPTDATVSTGRPALVPPPSRWTPTAVSLAHTPPTRIDLADSVRPGRAPAPEVFPVADPFERAGTRQTSTTWATPLPVATDLFPSRRVGARTFGYYAPEGLEVLFRGHPLPFVRNARRKGSWGYTHDHLLISLPADAGPPTPDDVSIRWPEATDREATRHRATGGLSDTAFLQRTEVSGEVSATGLFLPAPSSADWTLEVPDRGILFVHPTLLSPVIRTASRSDGATLVGTVTADGETREVLRHPIEAGAAGQDVRVDLSSWAGRTITLTLATTPGAQSDHDLVFIEDPVVYTPSDDPKRLVLAFLDTVRADHLGVYGYERPTTPTLDAWGVDAMVLEQQRTVSPWTLPSARAVLSGHQPEAWFDVPSLAERLSRAGFHTQGIVANAYLGQVFGMHRGFDRYTYHHLQSARETVDRALEILARFPDRDVFVYVQFMEAHLPYREPRAYRGLFEGDEPEGLRLTRSQLVRWNSRREGFEAVRDYTIARYDQNLRVLDDEVGRLIGQVGDDAGVVVFSDHGEEFWDHEGFEHGHSFHDELLHVPTILRHPTLPAGRLDAPTSLLDIPPTMLGLVGLPFDDTAPGLDLGPALRGDAAAVDALRERPQAFGRPLYDGPAWSVLDGGLKFLSRDGSEQVWRLAEDPSEKDDVAASVDRTGFGPAMAEALGREVPRVWRVTGSGRAARGGTRLVIRHPSGIAAAWTGYDPRGFFDDVEVEVVDGAARIDIPHRGRLPPVVFVQPTADAADPTGLVVEEIGGPTATVDRAVPPAADGSRVRIVGPVGALRVELDHAWAPPPVGTTVSAYHPDAAAALEALGYLEGGEDSDEAAP